MGEETTPADSIRWSIGEALRPLGDATETIIKREEEPVGLGRSHVDWTSPSDGHWTCTKAGPVTQAEAMERYQTDAVFHARAELAGRIVEQQAAADGYHMDETECRVARAGAALALLIVERDWPSEGFTLDKVRSAGGPVTQEMVREQQRQTKQEPDTSAGRP